MGQRAIKRHLAAGTRGIISWCPLATVPLVHEQYGIIKHCHQVVEFRLFQSGKKIGRFYQRADRTFGIDCPVKTFKPEVPPAYHSQDIASLYRNHHHTGFKVALAYGGTDYEKQRRTIQEGIDILIGTPGRIIDMEADYFENAWRVCCFGGFLFGREAVRRMQPKGSGTLLYTGASASLRGRAMFGAFNSSKAAYGM